MREVTYLFGSNAGYIVDIVEDTPANRATVANKEIDLIELYKNVDAWQVR